MKQYYVRTDTFWQNSPDRWEGPFDTRVEAQEWIDEKLDGPENYVMSGQSPRDIKTARRIFGIYSKTEARRLGLRSYVHGDNVTNVADELELPYVE